MKWKHKMYQTHSKNGCEDSDFIEFQEETNVVYISEVINRCKEEYQNHIALTLNDPKTYVKTYTGQF